MLSHTEKNVSTVNDVMIRFNEITTLNYPDLLSACYHECYENTAITLSVYCPSSIIVSLSISSDKFAIYTLLAYNLHAAQLSD